MAMEEKYKGEKGLVREVAKATGVDEQDVSKILDQLGLARVYADAVQANRGAELTLSNAKIAFKLGKNTVVV